MITEVLKICIRHLECFKRWDGCYLHSLVSYKDYSVPETLVTTGREREAAPVSLSSYVSLEFRIAFP